MPPPPLPPDHPDAPKYWMYETSGRLERAVTSYLTGEEMTASHIRLMRAYLEQWFRSPLWGPSYELETLRQQVKAIATSADIEAILDSASDIGIDPL